ncbi:MAG: hypothetical protein ICV60_17575, partial [Pyrinomonadaceae bacterium]|nr:hypothetical protein [Pyrinomonadaceae bacterium]
RAAAILAVLSILVALTPTPRTSAQQGASTGVAPTTKSAAVVAATAEVLKETAEIRELPILRPVKSGAQSRAEIERMIIKNMNDETKPEETRASELALKKLGLVPQDFEFRPFIVKLLTEQVAGYYDPKAQEFYLADWIDLDGQKPVMAHELTHALQDQHFNLRRFEKWPKGDSDAEMAAHALIEGDATLAMIRYVTRDIQRAVAFAKSLGTDDSSSEQIDKAPRAIRESLLFPYEQGSQWVTNLYRRGGWPLVSKAFTELPQSTEQILHADKYFAREAPVKVELADIHATLGASWKRIDYDVNGEWGCYLVLNEYLKTGAAAAAAGWSGDRFAVYEDTRSNQIFITQMTLWDTGADAREFFDAYARRTAARYAGASEIEVAASMADAEAKGWRTPNDGRVVMELRGKRVLILEGVPEKTDAAGLLKKVWG